MSASSKKKLRKEQNAAQLTEKQLLEQKEAKKLKTYTTTFVVIMVAVLVLSVSIMAVTTFINSGITERSTKAVTIGEYTLSNADLNYYFVDAINEAYDNWYESYGESMSFMVQATLGLDLTKPLDEQMFDETKTFADYFTEIAIENATEAYTMYDLAIKDGATVTEELAEEIDGNINTMNLYSQLYGFSNMKQYLQNVYGKGANEENMRKYLEVSHIASEYISDHYDGLKYEAADITAYDKEHSKDFDSYDYVSFPVRLTDHLICEAAEDDKDHEHTEAEEAAALKAAEEAAKALVATGVTNAEALDAEIKKLDAYKDSTAATSTESKDILYTELTNTDIAAWLSDAARTENEIGYIPYTLTSTDADGKEVKENLGYYVVIFNGKDDNTVNLVNVRHILAKFTGGTTGENGETVYTAEEKKAALDEINKIKATWEEGEKTEESFGKLATSDTDDTASSADGGLYEDVYPGQMVPAFNDWCFDANRKSGDVGVVETEYGYHLIYFVSTDENNYRNYMIENTMRNNDQEEWFNAAVDAVKVETLNTSKLSLDMVLSNG